MEHFAPKMRQRLGALSKKLAKRSGCITSVGAAVEDIGQHFALHGLEAPVRQLFQLMIEMDHVHIDYNAIPKPEERPHILKLVAAPGMGKVSHGAGHGVPDRRDLLIEPQTTQTCLNVHWSTSSPCPLTDLCECSLVYLHRLV